MDIAPRQGSLGIMMSTLILTAPLMAGQFFNGVMGQFHGANYFSGDQLVGKQANQAAQPGTPGYVPQSAPPPNSTRTVEPKGRYAAPG